MEDDEGAYTRGLARNVAAGLVVAYGVTIGMCLVGLHDLGQSAAIAVVPSVFAGPYVGILITLVGAVRSRGQATGAADAGA